MASLGGLLSTANPTNPIASLDPFDAFENSGPSTFNPVTEANAYGSSNTTTGNLTSQQILSQLGISSDNPNAQAIVTAAQQLAGQGYSLGAIQQLANPNSNYNISAGMFGYTPGSKISSSLQSALSAGQSWESQNAGTTPAERALNNQITATATNFQNNLPEMAYSLTQQAAQAQKSQLATALAGTQSNYNAMGLLFSNEEAGAKNANVQTAAANTTTAASDINQSLAQENEELQQGAINSQNTIQQLNQAGAQNNTNLTSQYNTIAEQNQALSNQAQATMGGALGSALGTAIGGLSNNAQGGYSQPAPTAPATTTSTAPSYNPMSSGLGNASPQYSLGVPY